MRGGGEWRSVVPPDEPQTPSETQAPVTEQAQATAPELEASTASPPADGGGDGSQVPAPATPGEATALAETPAADPPEGAATPEPEPQPAAEPSSLADLTERHPWMADQLAERDQVRENAGAQREQARVRTQAGTREATAKNVARVMDVWDEMEPEERVKNVGLLYEMANFATGEEATKTLGESVREIYDVPADVVQKAVGALDPANPDWGGYTRTLMDGAVASGIANASMSDVPEGSKLSGEITAEVNRRLAAEMTAREIEARPKEQAPPATPAGSGAPNGRKSMTDYKDPSDLLDAAVSGAFAASS